MLTTAERFWSKVDKDGPVQPHMDTPCWVWMAGMSRGYGRARANGRGRRAHRLAWELECGQIPARLAVLHRCDNPACVRVPHLFLGTPADNAHDRDAKGRGARLVGDRNGAHAHPERMARGEQQGSAKLTATQVLEIRTSFARGHITKVDLGRRFRVSGTLIGFIVSGKYWKHLPLHPEQAQ